MRKAFLRELTRLAGEDDRIVLLSGDLGFTVIEPFSERYPERFWNVGVAEQNMVGVATGLAEAGLIPFLYTIATFAVLRSYEFIRNGPLAHGLPVRIAGVGGGLEYGPAGFSHHAVEDVGVLRLQPRMTVIAPADHRQTASALRATWELPGPVYYRLGKDDNAEVEGLDGRFGLGRAHLVREGRDLLLISMGSVTSEAVAAAGRLEAEGVDCAVMVVSCLSPAPVRDLVAALDRFPVAVTVESHYRIGGLGSLISEVVAEAGLSCRVLRCGLDSMPTGRTGSLGYLRRAHGLSSASLAKTALAALERTAGRPVGHETEPCRSSENGH